MTTMANRQRRRYDGIDVEPSSWWCGFRAGACIALLFAVAAVLVIARLAHIA